MKANKKEKCFTKQIEIVHDFIKQNGYIVKCNEDNEDEFYPYLKTIFIKKRLDKELELFYLLHETGHLITHINIHKWRFENLPYTIEKGVDEKKEMKKALWQAASLSEEHEAWKNGKILSMQLGLSFDNKRYENEWADCIKDYIKFAYDNLFLPDNGQSNQD